MEDKKKISFYTKWLYLNTEYNISFRRGRSTFFTTSGLFIQTSPKGYNFLNLKTGKCIFSRALSTYMNEIEGNKIRMKFISTIGTEAIDTSKETISEELDTFASFVEIIITTPKGLKRKLADIETLT